MGEKTKDNHLFTKVFPISKIDLKKRYTLLKRVKRKNPFTFLDILNLNFFFIHNCIKKEVWNRHSTRHATTFLLQRNMRSKIRWFTELCNSHYVSQFAAFFIGTRAKRSTVESRRFLVLSKKKRSLKREYFYFSFNSIFFWLKID